LEDKKELAELIAESFDLAGYAYFSVVLLLAITSYAMVRFLLLPIINRMMARTSTEWDDILARKGVLSWLAALAPFLILYFGAGYAPEYTVEVLRQVLLACIVFIAGAALDRALSASLDIYELYPFAKERPIKAYVQLVKLVVYILGAVIVIALLLGKSPWGILGGIGMVAALAVLVFRDTILSLIANIQIVANDLVRRGDWIEIPEFGADGVVTDIALHTVKVRNWDKTIITIPTYKLVDGSFQNWRGMNEAGGRRIKRSLLIDQTSVRFCDEALLEKFWRICRLRPYLEAKKKELEHVNVTLDDDEDGQLPLNRRALTNLGTFRAYLVAYLRENTKLHDDMTLMVRQRPPTPNGLPLEVYVFSKHTSLVDYEGIQADIFDHLLAALPYFELRLFQYPTGENLKTLKGWLDSEMVA
jgi:miniconductance mechanosensitive channel